MHNEQLKLCTGGLYQRTSQLLYRKRWIADPNRVCRGHDLSDGACLSFRAIFHRSTSFTFISLERSDSYRADLVGKLYLEIAAYQPYWRTECHN